MRIEKEQLIDKLLDTTPYLKNNLDRLDKILSFIYSLDSSFNELIKNMETSKPRNIRSFLAEANVIYEMISALSKSRVKYKIKYEQETTKGKPDLKIELDNDIIIWVQIKCFDIGEMDNKRNKAIQLLKDKLRELYTNYFDIETSLWLSNKTVIEFLTKLKMAGLPDEYSFINNKEKIVLRKNALNDYFVKIKGSVKEEYRAQVINSFNKANKSLDKNTNKIINVIACQNIYNDIDLIDISNAIYGTDAIKYTSNNNYITRCKNGIIHCDEDININYYLSFDSNYSVIGECDKHMFIINENKTIDICTLFGINEECVYDKDTYIL